MAFREESLSDFESVKRSIIKYTIPNLTRWEGNVQGKGKKNQGHKKSLNMC